MNSKEILPTMPMMALACALGRLCAVIKDKELATIVLEDCVIFMRAGFMGDGKAITNKIAMKAVLEAARVLPPFAEDIVETSK